MKKSLYFCKVISKQYHFKYREKKNNTLLNINKYKLWKQKNLIDQ